MEAIVISNRRETAKAINYCYCYSIANRKVNLSVEIFILPVLKICQTIKKVLFTY